MPYSLRMLYSTSLLVKSYAFSDSINKWCTVPLYSQFSSTMWRTQNIWSLDDLLRRNSHRWSLIPFPTCVPNLERRMITFCMQLITVVPSIITTVSFNAFFTNLYNNRFLPLLWQFLFTPNRISKFVDLRTQWITSSLDYLCQSLISTWRFLSFRFAVAISVSGELGLGTNGSGVCISLCETSLTPCTFDSWWK
jgi:hypothetical protein